MLCQVNPDGRLPILWIQTLFHECAYSPFDASSIVFGYLSILFWIFAQMPQCIENFRRKNADSLSLLFLTNWLLGDVCNLIGCILTHQLPFQTYLASYFCLVDSCLFLQTCYYRFCSGQPETRRLLEPSSSVFPLDRLPRFLQSIIIFWFSGWTFLSPVAALSPESQDYNAYLIGQVAAWVCAALYLSSRIPQIYHNYNRKSVKGLSIGMFLCACMGNLTYTISILLKSSGDPSILLGSLAYLLGSGGTVMFDVTIFLQYLYYTRRNYTALPDSIDD